MSLSNESIDIPYLATAEAVMEASHDPQLFLLSLFPEATAEQIAWFEHYTAGKILDGIHLGLEICGIDPIGEVEAYQLGVQEGLSRNDPD